MLRVLQTAPLSIGLALMASSAALAFPRQCATAVCAAPAPDLGAGIPAILAGVLSLGVAAWVRTRTARRPA
jgi:hypothetical protein